MLLPRLLYELLEVGVTFQRDGGPEVLLHNGVDDLNLVEQFLLACHFHGGDTTGGGTDTFTWTRLTFVLHPLLHHLHVVLIFSEWKLS